MRRLMPLMAVAGLWLFLAAAPVLADGGPHVAAGNSGVTGINSDNCAGCHRAHTAQAKNLLIEEGTALCLSCHGATGLGSAVDVESGIQYRLGTTNVRGAAVLGSLRGGGFVSARIGSGEVARTAPFANQYGIQLRTKVPVRTAGSQPVTSAHLPNTAGVVGAAQGVAWGNGPDSATAYAGPAVEMDCTTCHNPHGNGNYRILNPIPNPTSTGTDAFVQAGAPGAVVTDAALPAAGDTRNYTIIQTLGGTNTLLASQVENLAVSATAGDYFRRYVPWNATAAGPTNDAPNGNQNFTTQISSWCLTCHSRYLGTHDTTQTPTGDAVFTFRHTSTSTTRNCITCHVSHGSNAQMTGTYSANMEYPGGAAAPVGDSRLLKIDNRGTCQACHDPTGTVTVGSPMSGPTPNPLLP